ncbi:MAG: ABC-2 family transporter protein [Isosphaeraceae bacterium]|nr:ABC-2 family transporter protein [Isosphaeraceae bacterium]
MTPPDAPTPTLSVAAEPRIVVPLGRRPRGPIAQVRKYLKILRVSLVERMTYRGDFLLGTLLRFLPMLTTILLWRAIYSGSGRSRLSGFDYNEMIAYLLLVNISRMFSSMPGLAAGIARDIREGTLKKYLLQPLDMISYLVSYRVAHKIAYIVASALPYALLFFLCRSFFVDLVPTDPWTWAAYALSLVLAFFVGFFFEASVGMVGFWFLEVTSLLYIVMTLNFFISGHMLPLDLLPPFWAGLLKSLPFQYMAYFPAVVFLGKIKGRALVYGLLGELFWALFFLVLARWLFRIGLKRYSAFGG